jgi:ABC-type transport system involved in multi-copper enzyme maturation permease subunit
MKVLAIALNTAREAIRNRILYSILFFAFLTVGVAAVFGAVSIGDQMKFVKDFSLMSVSLFSVVIAIVLGVNLLQQELQKRTILNILSKPVARWEFVVGKFLGLFATLALIIAVMSAVLLAFLTVLEGQFDAGLLLACGTALLEIAVIVAVAIFFSSLVVTPSLAGMFTAATFIAGRSSGYLSYFFSDEHATPTRVLAHVLHWILPRLDRFVIANSVVYGEPIEAAYLLALTGYAAAYSAIVLLLSILLFSRREFT